MHRAGVNGCSDRMRCSIPSSVKNIEVEVRGVASAAPLLFFTECALFSRCSISTGSVREIRCAVFLNIP